MERVKRQKEMRQVGSNIKHLLLAMKARLDERLQDRKVTSAQLRFLHELRKLPDVSGAKLARECSVTPQTAQAMLVRSVKAGWVVRGADKENGRLVTARLTPAGEELLAYAEEIVREFESEVWAGVSALELRTANTIIEKALANVEQTNES
jgi:DNA-binding MarR family transcriptional regulator